MKNWDAIKCIVSLTSYGDRLKILPVALKNIIELPEFHFVFTIYKNDKDKLTPQTREWIDDGLLELFIDDVDYRYHKKYMHAMEKYGTDYPVIIIDDDRFYTPDLLIGLYAAHLETPEYVIGTRGYIPVLDESGEPIHTSKWRHVSEPYEVDDVIPFGGYGVLYPPGFKPIYDFPSYDFNDDFTLHVAALKQGYHTRLIKYNIKFIVCDLVRRTATWIPRWKTNEDVDYFNFYRDILMKSLNNESVSSNS